MLHIKNIDEGLKVFKALGSEVRVQIVKLLLKNHAMNMNELATASRYDIPVIEIVVNNKVLGMVRQWQTLFYGKRYSATILDDKVDFVKVAEGLGVKAVRVTKLPELLPAVEQAVKEKVPYMIEVQIDKDDKVFPMVPAGAPIEDVFDQDDLKKEK